MPREKLYKARVYTVRQHVGRLKRRRRARLWKSVEVVILLSVIAAIGAVILQRTLAKGGVYIMMSPISLAVITFIMANIIRMLLHPFIRRSRR
jgi:hypothetical protein